MKIGIVGLGSVGSTIAYSIAVSGIAEKLVLVDQFPEKAIGEAMDLQHCAFFIPPVEILAGDPHICISMDVVVITAGSKRKPDEQRTDLIKRNLAVMKNLSEGLTRSNPNAIFIIVSNPVDLLTLYLTQHSSLESRQIIGSGTLLDTSRFRHLISKRINVDPRNVHTYIIGEHGAGSIPVWSHTQIGALHLDDFAEKSKITFGPDEKKQVFEAVLSAGKEVIKRKGATFYGIAQTVLRILTAILRDEKSILTVSTKVRGYADADDLTLSLPVIVGRRGVEKSPVPHLNREEMDGFQKAAESLKAIAMDVGIL